MQTSQQFRLPSPPETPPADIEAFIATARPPMNSFAGAQSAIGVAARLKCGDEDIRSYWMAGYAASDDMARGAMVSYLRKSAPWPNHRLTVWSRNIGTLKYVSAARDRGGMKSGRYKNKPFAAFDLFDPLEAALQRHEWALCPVAKDEEPGDCRDAEAIAKQALGAVSRQLHKFSLHKSEHPDWWMLRFGVTDTPDKEAHEHQ